MTLAFPDPPPGVDPTTIEVRLFGRDTETSDYVECRVTHKALIERCGARGQTDDELLRARELLDARLIRIEQLQGGLAEATQANAVEGAERQRLEVELGQHTELHDAVAVLEILELLAERLPRVGLDVLLAGEEIKRATVGR